MPWYRYLLSLSILIALAFVAVRLSGLPLPRLSIPGGEPEAEVQEAEDLTGLPADVGASELLDRVLAGLTAPQVHWLRADVWQRVRLPGLSYQTDGRYLLGPDQRFRLELRTQVESEAKHPTAHQLLVCDGANVWSANRVGAGDWQGVSHLGLHEVLAGGLALGQAAEVGTECFQGPTFGGLLPLLRNLRTKLTWVRQEELPGNRVRLSGCWPAAQATQLVSAGQSWPETLPRRCRVVVRRDTLWPERLEWWAPAGRGERLLAEMEFRNPVLNDPLPPAVCAREFAFTSATVVVTDLAAPTVADLAAPR